MKSSIIHPILMAGCLFMMPCSAAEPQPRKPLQAAAKPKIESGEPKLSETAKILNEKYAAQLFEITRKQWDPMVQKSRKIWTSMQAKLEIELSKEGKVEEVLLMQPYGTFTAHPK